MGPVRPKVSRVDPVLPLFRLERGPVRVLYTPGHVLALRPGEAEPLAADRLREPARRAVEEWSRRADAEFAPIRLTVYLSNQCELACPYCFAITPARRRNSTVAGEDAVLGAARLVARGAAAKRRPWHLILHGGGEPTMHWELVQRLVEGTRRIAAEAGTGCFAFLATHGVLAEDRAHWLARNLDLIGLSCDGPPDIQDRQRPLRSGGGSSLQVERTARVLAEAGGRFSVRTTITPETVARQAEIVAWLQERLGARELRFEPVYSVHGSPAPLFRPEDADGFVAHFLEAQREARRRGCDLRFAGVALDELHGPYCNVLQDALHLLPDGAVTACFFLAEGGLAGSHPLIVGRWDGQKGEITLDAGRIAAHRHAALAIPARCRDCINVFHCARECPERCMVHDAPLAGEPGFRCVLEQRLAEEWILEAAG